MPQKLWLSFSDDGVLREVARIDEAPCAPFPFCSGARHRGVSFGFGFR